MKHSKNSLLLLLILLPFFVSFADEMPESCVVYLDQDGDGYGSKKVVFDYDCSDFVPSGYAKKNGDCNDQNRYINPGVTEECNGIDDNCDGIVDPENSLNCNNYYEDKDGDGFGTANFRCLCVSEGVFSALESGDCDDNNSKANPQAKEVCNGIDNNCNGEIDDGEDLENCTPFYIDNDGDGFGIPGESKCLCKPLGLFRATLIGDCNDNNSAIYRGAYERFDRLDNNCNGIIDENPANLPPPPKPKKFWKKKPKK